MDKTNNVRILAQIILVSAGGVVCIIVGIIVFIVGLSILGWSLNLPMLFAGQYLIFAGLIIVGGIVLIVIGARRGRKKQVFETVNPVICKNCGSSNSASSEFCGKCGIKIR
jgi:ribosomal protein L40E